MNLQNIEGWIYDYLKRESTVWAKWWANTVEIDFDYNTFDGKTTVLTIVVPTDEALRKIGPHLDQTLFKPVVRPTAAKMADTVPGRLFCMHFGAESSDGVYFTGDYGTPRTKVFKLMREGKFRYLLDDKNQAKVKISKTTERTYVPGGDLSDVNVRFHFIAGLLSTPELSKQLKK